MSKWQVVRSYPLEWLIVASIPLLMWVSVYAFGYLMSRGGRIKVKPNVLAISGALLAYVSFLTGWGVVERGYDWMVVNDLSLFLLFTYPVAVITPLAGIGQAVVLLWVLSYRQETGGSIGPLYGYLIAWISVMLMLASIVWPMVNGRARSAPDIYDRLLTLTIRRRSRQWMSAERALAVLLTIIFLVIGATYLALGKDVGAVALLFVGLVFALFMLSRHPNVEAAAGEQRNQSGKLAMQCPHCGIDNQPGSANCVGCGTVLAGSSGKASSVGTGRGTERAHMAWVLFVAASYVAAIIVFSPVIGAFYSGYSGEERTRLLVEVLIVLAVVVPIAALAHRRAQVPPLPRELVVASVVLFASFILAASLQLSSTISIGSSVAEFLLFAGIALVGPAFFYVQTRNGGKKMSGGRSSDSR
ncbi:MAG TPA: zinc ribbon domain-containing protein [Thermoplasmata archaeon]